MLYAAVRDAILPVKVWEPLGPFWDYGGTFAPDEAQKLKKMSERGALWILQEATAENEGAATHVPVVYLLDLSFISASCVQGI